MSFRFAFPGLLYVDMEMLFYCFAFYVFLQ